MHVKAHMQECNAMHRKVHMQGHAMQCRGENAYAGACNAMHSKVHMQEQCNAMPSESKYK